jgi:hypothetical protein
VASLYYLRLLQIMMAELFSNHCLKFRMPETARYRKRRQKKLYSFKKMKRPSTRGNKRLRRHAR